MFQCSEQIDQIASAVAAAQAIMENAARGSVNETFNSRYADLGAVRRACIPALASQGVAVLQAPHSLGMGEITLVDRPGQSGQPPRSEARAVMRVSVTTRFVHASGQWMESTLSTLIADGTVWPMGSAITYLSRYGLAAMAGVALEDDDGVRANQARPAFEGARVRDQAAGRAMRAATASPTIADTPTRAEAVSAARGLARETGFMGGAAAEAAVDGMIDDERAAAPSPRRSRGPSGGGNGGGTRAYPAAAQAAPPARRVLRDDTGQAMAEEAASPAITPQEAARLNRLLDAVGLTSRPEKMDWLEGQIGHSISSLRHLTVREALACVTVLEGMVSRAVLNANAPEEQVLPF